LKKLFITVFLFLLFCGAEAEIRSLWVLPWNIKSPQAIDTIIEDAILHNQNELLLEVRYRSDALYTPNRLSKRFANPEPRSYILDIHGFDPLEYAIVKAKERGLRVQAWVVVYNATPLDQKRIAENYIWQNHRDWLTRDASGKQMTSKEQYGYFLDPGVPEVQDYLLEVFSDVVLSYPLLDGLHLDYIRYPSVSFGYHPTSVKRYEEAKTHESLSWNQWRMRQVTEFVEKLRTRIKGIRPNLILSAAVFSSIYEARNLYAQDWFDWLDRGIIDYAYPMAYHVKYDAFVNQMKAMEENGNTDKIVVGLRAWNARGGSLLERQSPQYNINHIEDRIRYLREKDYAGISLFSYEGIIQDSALRFLADRAYPTAARLPELLADAGFGPRTDVLFHNSEEGYLVDLVLPAEGKWNWDLLDADQAKVYQRFRYYYRGLNQDRFDGLLANGECIPSGSYTMHLYIEDTEIEYHFPVILEGMYLD
jgi:uncharacterized lipoprotein YddW (UPF0748 family)